MKPEASISRLICAALMALPALASADGQTLVYGNVSGWTVRTDPAHGYRCFAEAQYEGDSSIRIGFDTADGAMNFRLSDGSWTHGVSGNELSLQFDDGEPLRFEATVADGNAVTVAIPADEQQSFIRSFTAGYSITAWFGGHEPIMLSLGGSSRATQLLSECETTMANVGARPTPAAPPAAK